MEELMKIVGLIAEYNPFHNGHQYHIEKAKEITGADAVIVVMSGNFVQRGTPAIMPKHMRAEAALRSGASLVIELPVYFATASAEIFAFGAVSLLDQLGCVDSICFGSECGEIESLQKIAEIVFHEPDTYKKALQQHLKSGDSFPLAREKALLSYLEADELKTVVTQPNNILGIEYLKALYRLESNITPYTVQRLDGAYHDTELKETYSSASAIRKIIADNRALCVLDGQVPDSCLSMLNEAYEVHYPVYTNDFSLLLKYRLLQETKESLVIFADVSEELANRIYNNRNQFINYEQFCDLLKTKELTYTRISRALLHILLEIKKAQDMSHAYIRVLGFRKEATAVLTIIKNTSTLPLLTKLLATDEITFVGKQLLEMDVFAANLYHSVVTEKFHTPFIHEYEQQIIKI